MPPVARPRPRASAWAPSSALPAPSASRPAPKLGFGDAGAKLAHSRSGSGQAAAELPDRPQRAVLPARDERLAFAAQGSHFARDPGWADDRLHPRFGRDAALPATQLREALRLGNRAAVGCRDDDERRFEAGARDAGQGFAVAARRVPAAQLRRAGRAGLQAERRRGQDEDDSADRDRDGHRSRERRVDDSHQTGRPAVRRGPDPPPIDPRAEQKQRRRPGDRGDQDAEDDHQRDRGGERCEQRAGHDEERDDHRKEQRAAGEGGGPARRVAGRDRRLQRFHAGGQFLSKARDHQERVIHPQGEAHHRADGQRQRIDVEPMGEDDEDASGAEDDQRAEGERDRRRDRRAEDEKQDDQQDRQRDQLAALTGRDRFVLDLT